MKPTLSSSHRNVTYSYHDIAVNLLTCIKQQSYPFDIHTYYSVQIQIEVNFNFNCEPSTTVPEIYPLKSGIFF